MPVARIDPMWARPCVGYHVQVLPDRSALGGLAGVQSRIERQAPGALHRCPPEALHITLVNLVDARAPDDDAKEAAWRGMAAGCARELAALAAETAPFTMTYRRCMATKDAIIAVSDDTAMADLRQSVLDRLPVPEKMRRRYDFAHTTLFRFREALADPAARIERAGTARIEVPSLVDRLVLTRETVYPSLATEALSVAELGGRE